MSKRYSRSATLFFDIPLALLPAKRDEIIAFWETKLAGQSIDWEEHQEPFAARIVAESEIDELDLLNDQTPKPTRSNKIAIIPIYGLISQRMSMMSAFSGGTSTDQVSQAFLDVLHNPEIKAIIFDIDSPGGSTFGVTELANLIMESRGQKPIVAFANSLAASAGYWIGAAADHFFATPSALVGSIGVYTVHTDLSKAVENEGIKVTFIQAGKNKTRGNEFEPLSEDDTRYLQSIVDDAYDMFVSDVARGRRVSGANVLKNYGEGDVFTTRKATEVGMIDGAKNSLAEVIAGVGSLRPRRPAPRSFAAQAQQLTEENHRFTSVQDESEESLSPDEKDTEALEQIQRDEEESQARQRAWQALQWEDQKARAEAFSVPHREVSVNGN